MLLPVMFAFPKSLIVMSVDMFSFIIYALLSEAISTHAVFLVVILKRVHATVRLTALQFSVAEMLYIPGA